MMDPKFFNMMLAKDLLDRDKMIQEQELDMTLYSQEQIELDESDEDFEMDE